MTTHVPVLVPVLAHSARPVLVPTALPEEIAAMAATLLQLPVAVPRLVAAATPS